MKWCNCLLRDLNNLVGFVSFLEKEYQSEITQFVFFHSLVHSGANEPVVMLLSKILTLTYCKALLKTLLQRVEDQE